MRLAVRPLLVLLIALAAASCAESAQEGAGGPPDPAAGVSEGDAGEGPGGSGLSSDDGGDGESSSAGSALGASTMLELGRLVDGFNNPDVNRVGECMYDAGFPQFLESMSELEANDARMSDPLRSSPMQIAPYSEDQARSLGMVGRRYVWPHRSQVGNVITYDRAYSAALESCKSEVRGDVSADQQAEMQSVTRVFWDMYNEMNRAFTRAMAAPLLDLLRDQLVCVRDSGYPEIDVDTAVAQPSWEPILAAAGVEIGQEIMPERLEADEPVYEVAEPEVEGFQVILPSDEIGRSYLPSASEVEFALAYVDCRQELGALERFEQIQHDARTPILERYETQILGLQEKVLAIVDP